MEKQIHKSATKHEWLPPKTDDTQQYFSRVYHHDLDQATVIFITFWDFDALSNFQFTTSETVRNFYL